MGALSGPRRGPKLPGPARQLVVLLHGYGSSGEEFLRVAPLLQRYAPHAAFAAPNGPTPCDRPERGFQWWPPTNGDPTLRLQGAEAARARLDAYIADELARLGLPEDRLVLAGFSQGAMAALYVGLRRRRIAGVISFSGDLIDQAIPTTGQASPPVLLLHGAEDDVLPPTVLDGAEAALRGRGVPVEAYINPGLGHGVGLEGVRRAGALLRRLFP